MVLAAAKGDPEAHLGASGRQAGRGGPPRRPGASRREGRHRV